MQKLTTILVTTAALWAGACGGDEADSDVESPPDGGVVSGDASQCSDLTYDTFGQAFLESYCVSCHGPALAQSRVHLDTLSGLTTIKKKALSAVSGGSMPPRGATAPSSAERAMFKEWIQCGGT